MISSIDPVKVYFALLILSVGRHVEGNDISKVSGIATEKVSLRCTLREDTCGSIHSIKWHRGFQRVYFFSELGDIVSKAEDGLVGRADLRVETNNSLAVLEIDPLETGDEGLYRCEVTYLEASEHCTSLQYIRLNTFAKPSYVRIEYMSATGTEAVNASGIGPFVEGTALTLVCDSMGGKPVPMLNWFNNSVPIDAQYINMTKEDGSGVATSQLEIVLGRGDLGSKFECRAASSILDTPMTAWVEVDVSVRPASWEITGYDAPVLEGTILTLLCTVKGARPAANITWYNGSIPIVHQPQPILAVEARTYETQSRFSFAVTRYDNGIIIGCQTWNLVMESIELPYWAKKKIEVHYKPVVSIFPKNFTANETTDIYLICEDDANPAERISVTWFQNGQILDVRDLHYEGGTTDEPNLHIKNASKYDLGNYTCSVENIIGESMSNGFANINVLYKPMVWLSIDPPTPIREQDEANVTLSCDLQYGNPKTLDVVRWYLGTELQKELTLCSNTTENYNNMEPSENPCNLDTTKLIIINVSRSFHGDYHCQAMNSAGWGEFSPPTSLPVYYPPGPPTIDFDPLISVKGQKLTLRCLTEDPGRPVADKFRWWKGNHLQLDQTSSNWTIFPVKAEHRANFSCEASNEAGSSRLGSVQIVVFVPPNFITSLPAEHGVAWNASEVNVTCEVECFPHCGIDWLKNSVSINYDPFYPIKTTKLRAEPLKNQFESIRSTLSWNAKAFPNGTLNRWIGDDNFTCQSSANEYGPGVKSTTQLRIQYPPENITVSARILNVTENEYPEIVTCSSNGLPEPTYTWKYGDEVVSVTNTLLFNYTLKRNQGGDYECIAQNPYGEISERITINVHYIPGCNITFEARDDEGLLVCTAQGNPGFINFNWSLENSSFPYPKDVKTTDVRSELRMNPTPEYFGTYGCHTSNSVGSYTCTFPVPVSWLRTIAAEDNTLLIFVAVAVAVILIFLILCIAIIVVCRKKRTNEKQSHQIEERQNPEGSYSTGTVSERSFRLAKGSSSHNMSSTFEDSNSEANKWPIKPGVHLHVNGLHSLGKSVSGPVDGFSFGKKSSCGTLPLNITQTLCEDADKIVVANAQLKNRMPAPGPRADLMDDGKAYYENLPFHGLQTPESNPIQKPLPATVTSTEKESEIRPSSELSQTGNESGYGSTRSRHPKETGLVTINPGASSSALEVTSKQPEPSIRPAVTDIPPPVPAFHGVTDMPPRVPPAHVSGNEYPLPHGGQALHSNTSKSTPQLKIPLLVGSSSSRRGGKLATVIPRRTSSASYSSYSSLHAFPNSVPEASKIFFSSIRGKPLPPIPLNHFLARSSTRIRRSSIPEAEIVVTSAQRNPKLSDKSYIPTKAARKAPNQRKTSTDDIKFPAQMKSSSSFHKNDGSIHTRNKPICSNFKSNDRNNNRSGASSSVQLPIPDEGWKPTPLPAPRIQTLKQSRRHTYQNIPFTRKTPRAIV